MNSWMHWLPDWPVAARAAAFGAAALLCTAACCAAGPAWKPEQNVEIVVGTGPGAGGDVTARLVQKIFQEKRLVEVPSFVVNKAGGGGVLALTYIVQNAGSARHLFFSSPTLLTNQIMGKTTLTYTDLTPLAQIGTEYVVFSVVADSPLKIGRDLVARFRQDGGGLAFALANSLGNHNHIAIAQLATATGVDVKKLKVVVFQSSADVVTSLLGGHVDVVASPGSAVYPHVQAGKVRILAAAAERRLSGALGAVPTWSEQGVRVVSANWRNVSGPKGMTEAQVQYWDGVFGRLVQQDEWKRDVEARQFENTYLNSAETRRLMDAQRAELTAILRAVGLAK